MDIAFKDAFDLFQKETAELNQVWTFYSTVALALLTGVFASEKIKKSLLSVSIIVVGFLIFAGANLKEAALKPMREASGVIAGLKAAVSTYAQGQGRRGGVERIAQDEEMFI